MTTDGLEKRRRKAVVVERFNEMREKDGKREGERVIAERRTACGKRRWVRQKRGSGCQKQRGWETDDIAPEATGMRVRSCVHPRAATAETETEGRSEEA